MNTSGTWSNCSGQRELHLRSRNLDFSSLTRPCPSLVRTPLVVQPPPPPVLPLAAAAVDRERAVQDAAAVLAGGQAAVGAATEAQRDGDQQEDGQQHQADHLVQERVSSRDS